MPPTQLFRLVGVGLSNFQVETEPDSPLFTSADAPLPEQDTIV
jgi:hypothetical protein